jgi:GNAT superfamily N-acetyltransferase
VRVVAATSAGRLGPGELLIRPLCSADRHALKFEFDRLSEESRYQRFLAPKRKLTSGDLDYMLDVDHWHHEALIAWSPLPRSPIADACYVRRDQFDLAEVAITVVDQWQRAGVGRALLSALRDRAAAAGIRRFTASMFLDNRGALALMRELGPLRVVARGGAVVEMVADLSGVAHSGPHSTTTRTIPGGRDSASPSAASISASGRRYETHELASSRPARTRSITAARSFTLDE